MKGTKEGHDDFDMRVLGHIQAVGAGFQWDLAPVLAAWVRSPEGTIPQDWKVLVTAELRQRGLLTQAA